MSFAVLLKLVFSAVPAPLRCTATGRARPHSSEIRIVSVPLHGYDFSRVFSQLRVDLFVFGVSTATIPLILPCILVVWCVCVYIAMMRWLCRQVDSNMRRRCRHIYCNMRWLCRHIVVGCVPRQALLVFLHQLFTLVVPRLAVLAVPRVLERLFEEKNIRLYIYVYIYIYIYIMGTVALYRVCSTGLR